MVGSLRVLHVAQPTTEGVAVMTRELVADQVRRGWDVTVACPPDGDLPGWAEDLGARVLAWSATRNPGPSVAREHRALRRIVTAHPVDVVHLQSSKAGLVGRLLLRGRVPTVFSPHAWSFLATDGVQGAAALRWERWATRWTNVVLAVSDAEVQAGQRAGIRAHYAVARNGVHIPPAPSDDDRAAARATLRLPAGPLAVCIGRVCRQKGQDVLLDAWPAVRTQVPDAELRLIGDGPDLEAIRGRQVAGVTAVGRRSDVPLWLAAADVVVLPSRWEGLSLALLEAMAAGRPVVATDVAGSAEALGGLSPVVPAEDSAALAAAVAGRLSEREQAATEGAALRARAVDCFDIARTTDEVAAIYRELARP